MCTTLHPGSKGRVAIPYPGSKGRAASAVFIFEVEGGNDKGPDGHRPDTGPLVAAFERRGWNATVLFYTDRQADSILHTVAAKGDAYIARINPGGRPPQGSRLQAFRV